MFISQATQERAQLFLTNTMQVVCSVLRTPISARIIFNDTVDIFGISTDEEQRRLIVNSIFIEKKFARRLDNADRGSYGPEVPINVRLARSRERLYENFSQDMIDGAMAHEIGHVVEDPNNNIHNTNYTLARIVLAALVIVTVIGYFKLFLIGTAVLSIYLINKEITHIHQLQASEFAADRFAAQIPAYRQGLIDIFTRFHNHFEIVKEAHKHHLPLTAREEQEVNCHRDLLSVTKRAFLKVFGVDFHEEENLIDHPTYAERIAKLNAL